MMVLLSTITLCILLVAQASEVFGRRSLGTKDSALAANQDSALTANQIREINIKKLCDRLGIKYGDLLAKSRRRRMNQLRLVNPTYRTHDVVERKVEIPEKHIIDGFFSSTGRTFPRSTGKRIVIKKKGRKRKLKFNFGRLASMFKSSAKRRIANELDVKHSGKRRGIKSKTRHRLIKVTSKKDLHKRRMRSKLTRRKKIHSRKRVKHIKLNTVSKKKRLKLNFSLLRSLAKKSKTDKKSSSKLVTRGNMEQTDKVATVTMTTMSPSTYPTSPIPTTEKEYPPNLQQMNDNPRVRFVDPKTNKEINIDNLKTKKKTRTKKIKLKLKLGLFSKSKNNGRTKSIADVVNILHSKTKVLDKPKKIRLRLKIPSPTRSSIRTQRKKGINTPTENPQTGRKRTTKLRLNLPTRGSSKHATTNPTTMPETRASHEPPIDISSITDLQLTDEQIERDIISQLRNTPEFIEATKVNTPEADMKIKRILDGILQDFGTQPLDNLPNVRNSASKTTVVQQEASRHTQSSQTSQKQSTKVEASQSGRTKTSKVTSSQSSNRTQSTQSRRTQSSKVVSPQSDPKQSSQVISSQSSRRSQSSKLRRTHSSQVTRSQTGRTQSSQVTRTQSKRIQSSQSTQLQASVRRTTSTGNGNVGTIVPEDFGTQLSAAGESDWMFIANELESLTG